MTKLCPCRMELLLLNAAYPRSHRASFLSRRRRLARYYTKKTAFLSALCTRGRRCLLSINLDCLGFSFLVSPPARRPPMTHCPHVFLCLYRASYVLQSTTLQILEPSHSTFPSLNCQPGDNWAGPMCNRPVTTRQFGVAQFAPEPILCVLMHCCRLTQSHVPTATGLSIHSKVGVFSACTAPLISHPLCIYRIQISICRLF
jgi:hypothetical protein